MKSLRRKLLVTQIGVLLITGVLASLLTYSLAWDVFNRQRNYNLEQIAYSIVRHGVVSANGEEDDEDPADRGQFVSQIWNADGSLAYSSIEGVGPPPQPPGMHTVLWQGDEWHIYSLYDRGLTIQVGNPVGKRAVLFANIVPWLLLPLTVLVLVLAGLIWLSVTRGLAPLKQLRAEISRRDAGTLTPLETVYLPDEVTPLVATLNDLLARLESALNAQGRFVADAAHELRTPLAAVRLQAQLARQTRDPAEHEASLRQLMAGIDRASHLVEQLLQLARLEPGAWHDRRETVALDDLARQVVASLSAQADARDIDLGVGVCEAVTLPGHAPSLSAMLANLVDNALRYIPKGGRVDVEVRATPEAAILSVADDGPGIPPEERERVFNRFYRGAGAEIPGSGLGLSIVKQAVELHGGVIELGESESGGLLARITLPRTKSAPDG
jgi:signal transduction histidine kinase